MINTLGFNLYPQYDKKHRDPHLKYWYLPFCRCWYIRRISTGNMREEASEYVTTFQPEQPIRPTKKSQPVYAVVSLFV